MNENFTAFYVHRFAHQLRLALITVAKKYKPIAKFFDNVIGASYKRHSMLQNIQSAKVLEALNAGELESGQSLNKETRLKRPKDARGSHYGTLLNLIFMFSFVVDVLKIISKDNTSENMGVAASQQPLPIVN